MKSTRIFWCHPRLRDYRVRLFQLLSDRFEIKFFFQEPADVKNDFDSIYASGLGRIRIRGLGLMFVGFHDLCAMYSGVRWSDVFVSSFVWNSYSIVGLVLCKLFNKRVVIWEEVNVVHPGLRFGIQHALIRLALKHIDAFFVCGESQNHFLISNGVAPEGIFVTNEYPGHVYSDVQPRPVALPFKAHEKVILYLGRLVEVKGVKYLIEAFSVVEKQCNDAALVIVGDGYLRKDLENLARQLGLHKIHFTGYIADIRAKSYLFGRSCMVVVPSVITEKPSEGGSYEAGAIVVLEALSAGRPVIGTDALGSSEVFIKDGINGYIVPKRNVDALADKIVRLLAVPIMSKQVLLTFSEIKGPDYQVEQFQKAVSYGLRR